MNICWNIDDNKILKILNKYFNQIEQDIKNEKFSFFDALYCNMVLSESYEFIENKNTANELIHYNMLIIKEEIESKNLIGGLSLFGGLSEVALTVYSINKNTGLYKNFLDKINILLLKKLELFIKNIKLNGARAYDLDVISGICGITSYILLLDDYKDLTKELLEIIILSFNNNTKLSWKNNETNTINLTLAHGIAGALVILSKAYKKGIYINGQLEAINYIIKVYEKYIKVYDKHVYWPGEVLINYYYNESNDCIANRDGWCSGSISIARSLMIASEAINNKKLLNIAINIIKIRANDKIYNYNLISPSLCHGYSSILSILNIVDRFYSDSNIKIELKKIKEIIESMFDENTKYGFYDIEVIYYEDRYITIKNDNIIFLKGATGIILSLLSLYKKQSILEAHLLI